MGPSVVASCFCFWLACFFFFCFVFFCVFLGGSNGSAAGCVVWLAVPFMFVSSFFGGGGSKGDSGKV